jgi:hypothetical protein
VLSCRAALPLSRQALTFVSGIIRRHRAWTVPRWRKLNCGQQALLVLAYLRKGEVLAAWMLLVRAFSTTSRPALPARGQAASPAEWSVFPVGAQRWSSRSPAVD